MAGDDKTKRKIKKYIRVIILALIFLIILYICIGFYKESKIKSIEQNSKKIEIDKIMLTKQTTDTKEKVNIPDTYMEFDVIAELIIPKINLKTYILSDYNMEKMNYCPTKFWGPEPNETGNFCITGHNYNKENMFNNLIDLEVGDELYLLDNKNGKFTYTVYDIYKVKPNNTNSLNQDTKGNRIITLITCVNYSNTRLIVQAIEKGI